MFVSIYVEYIVQHPQQPDRTYVDNTMYVNTDHVVYIDEDKLLIRMSNGDYLWTNDAGIVALVNT